MKKILSILAAAMTLLVTACDGHKDFPDASMKVGDIVCTDGNVLPWDKYEQSDKKAIAVVFHINQNEDVEGNGYAVYLYDIAPEAFCDSIGVEQGTSADITAYDGNMNTFALYDTKEVSSPLAERVFDLWRYGQSAYIPSVAQLRLLYQAREAVNPYITKCGGHPYLMMTIIAGTGLLRKLKDRKRPRHGCIRLEVVPCRKLPSGSHTRHGPSIR